ncbi:DUF6525 family protein [Acidimangrovimonas sediminis]|uniref:DUF6525 family protein n=1 Tax=Acidimangrovimonas sediminis TaxID=2056283 RepID=UPI000C807BA0|nr:DUF6525 family protein [Acidimangrovimonas sediminis]
MKRAGRGAGSGANLGSARVRKRRRSADPMAEYDRLPAPLRQWLAGAVLPWSARSAARAWNAALGRVGGDPARARDVLTEIEARQLSRTPHRPAIAG